jgi:hypothetical protein
MSDFNYEKAWFIFAKPAMENLNHKQANAYSKIIPLIGEFTQDRNLNIPRTPAIDDLLSDLTTKELAELARASEFYGHWEPGKVEVLYNNSRGESWKITNVIDQILRERLNLAPGLQIHDGILRVTFSSKDCWIWDKFGLATEENLEIYKNCKLPFGENSLHNSVKILKTQTGDMWDTDNVDNLPDNDDYIQYCAKKQASQKEKARQELISAVEDKRTEYEAFKWLLDHNIDFSNCIYYPHTKQFCFGWRSSLGIQEIEQLKVLLVGFPYPVEFK